MVKSLPCTSSVQPHNFANICSISREASYAMIAYLDQSSSSTLGLDFDPAPPLAFRAVATLAQVHGSGNVLPPQTAQDDIDMSIGTTSITALELGSGTGFIAARVAEWLRPDLDLLVATDLPDVCPLLETNLRHSPTVRVRPLAWGNAAHAQAISEELGLLNVNQALPHASTGGPARHRYRVPTHILCSDLVCPSPPFLRQLT